MESTARIARKMAALTEMGFQRAPSPSIPPESVPTGDGRFKVTCSQPSMGTLVSVTAVHGSSGLIQEAAGLAFQEMERVVNLLNRYDSSSALSFLNTEGSIHGPPPELSAVLWQARYFHQASQGAFDPTVQPLVDLFRNGFAPDPASSPSKSEVLEALALVDGSGLELSPEKIGLANPGMGVTLDGIAKGYVVDRMASVLSAKGLEDFLIDAGGDIRTSGVRDDGQSWQIGVQDPMKQGDLPDVIALTNGSVATSGSYETYFDRERTRHHIVSAGLGGSPQFSQSVSVVAPTTLAADALATGVFVMEPERGIAFIESIPQCACLIVDENGRQLRSKGWQSATDLPTPKAGIP